MPGPSPAPCTFPDDFVQVALDTVRRRTVAVQVVQRFRLALLLHEQPDMKNDQAAKEVGLSARQVQRWRSRWAAGDFSIEDQAGRGRKPVFSPSGSSVDPSDGVRDDRRDGRALEPAIACWPGVSRANDAEQKDQPEHGVADVARVGDQTLAA